VPDEKYDPKDYFQTVVRKYNNGDIDILLRNMEHMDGKAGPLFAAVMDGIDLMGGMLYGFKGGNSCDRSTRYMREEMDLLNLQKGVGSQSEDEALVLYKYGRCGLLHEGATKYRVSIRFQAKPNGNDIFSVNGNDLVVNVVPLAREFLESVKRIAQREDINKLKTPSLPSGQLTDSLARVRARHSEATVSRDGTTTTGGGTVSFAHDCLKRSSG